MYADKYPRIFSRQMEAIVYLYILLPIIPQAPCVSAFHADKRMEAGSEADNSCGSTVILLLYCIPKLVMLI